MARDRWPDLGADQRLERDADRLIALIDAINAAHHIQAELLGVAQDSRDGARTYALERLRREADLLDGAAPDRALSALVTSGVAISLVDEALAAADRARGLARDLELPSFAAHVDQLHTKLDGRRRSLRAAAQLARLTPRAAGPTGHARLDGAIERATGFLLADPEMREAWDVYRTGFLGEPLRTGRPYPVGFALENMAAAGLAVGAQISEVLALYQTNQGDYFDGPVRLPRDVDTAGLMLRLRARVAGDNVLDKILRAPLPHIAAALEAGCGLPVWVAETAPSGSETNLLGLSCTSSQVNLLLGVARQADPELASLLDDGCCFLAATLDRVGTGRTCFYTPRYLTWLLTELAGTIGAGDAGLSAHAAALRTREARRAVRTAQDAAFLLIAGAQREAPSKASEWVETILRAQRPDGGWTAEALYWAPTPQQLGYWYASRTATSSLCLRALTEVRQRGV